MKDKQEQLGRRIVKISSAMTFRKLEVGFYADEEDHYYGNFYGVAVVVYKGIRSIIEIIPEPTLEQATARIQENIADWIIETAKKEVS